MGGLGSFTGTWKKWVLRSISRQQNPQRCTCLCSWSFSLIACVCMYVSTPGLAILALLAIDYLTKPQLQAWLAPFWVVGKGGPRGSSNFIVYCSYLCLPNGGGRLSPCYWRHHAPRTQDPKDLSWKCSESLTLDSIWFFIMSSLKWFVSTVVRKKHAASVYLGCPVTDGPSH